jgi:hypothetical protein
MKKCGEIESMQKVNKWFHLSDIYFDGLLDDQKVNKKVGGNRKHAKGQ